jgi:hypothetical protein
MVRRHRTVIASAVIASAVIAAAVVAGPSQSGDAAGSRPRVIVSTDVGGTDPDDF